MYFIIGQFNRRNSRAWMNNHKTKISRKPGCRHFQNGTPIEVSDNAFYFHVLACLRIHDNIFSALHEIICIRRYYNNTAIFRD